ncbi:MAG TPA: alpha/beta fold hydrolase, partial [Pyrinomonadaceae bacterium]|nr:alpha/beta fold hydrolase [Pyrinomonadaceae bacterium]
MLKLKNFLLIFALLSLIITVIPAQTQNTNNNTARPGAYTIDRYLNIRSATAPTFSAQGDRVAFLTNITGTNQVWTVNSQGGWPDQMTFYEDRVDFVEWSPDGSGLVFGKAHGGDENAQLYWLAADGSQVKALTNNPQVRYNFGSWSHDGKRISYASNRRNPDFFDIYVMDVSTGREEIVYQQDGSNSPEAWSMDGTRMIVSHEDERLSLNNDLYLIDLTTKQATHLTPHDDASQFESVHFTGDGRSILLSTDLNRDFLSLARMDLQTKKIEILDEMKWDVNLSEISQDARLIAYAVNRDGMSELYVREVSADGTLGAKGAPLELPGKGVASGIEFSKNGNNSLKLAFSFSGPRFNPDVWVYDLATRKLSQVTHSSRAGIPQTSFVEPELIHYKTFDGLEIPAWYYRPQSQGASLAERLNQSNGNCGCDASTPSSQANLHVPAAATTRQGAGLPVIVLVHGGPEGQAQSTFSDTTQYFLSRGYAVLAPNVRGSTGYGKTYTHLDDVRRREDSVRDLAASVEWLKTAGGADAKRIAVMGGSYGGYMTY